MPVLISLAIIAMISTVILLKKNLSLQKEIRRLTGDIRAQCSKLDYQQEQYADSVNYAYSAMLLIINMMRQIDVVLKGEVKELPQHL